MNQSIQEVYSFVWGRLKGSWKALIFAQLAPLAVGFIGLLFFIGVLYGAYGNNLDSVGDALGLILLVAFLIGVPLTYVTTRLYAGQVVELIKLFREERQTLILKQIWKSGQGKFWRFLAVGLVQGLVVGIGFLLLIVPGILAIFAYFLVIYIALDKPELSIRNTFKRSRALMNNKWHLAVRYVLIPAGLYIIATLALGSALGNESGLYQFIDTIASFVLGIILAGVVAHMYVQFSKPDLLDDTQSNELRTPNQRLKKQRSSQPINMHSCSVIPTKQMKEA